MPRYAAVDIGSNSVRMLAAEVVPGEPVQTLAATREVTRLGTSVFSSGRISDEAMEHVCSVLRRMAEEYSKVDVLAVRAVATSAVRDASNQVEFIDRASEALGAPVEIISGPEEARLIHLGVQSRWPHPTERILIIDVGGGSAEFIVANAGEIQHGGSRPLGAVRLTEVFLKNDPPTALELLRMERFIDEKFEPALARIGEEEFDRVIGTSATAAAIVSGVNDISRSDREAADRLRAKTSQVRKLYQDLTSMNLAARRKVPGIGPRRAEIIVAGAAVFMRVLERLRIESLFYSTAGVRDGIIADLHTRGAGRELTRLSDQQLAVVEGLANRYRVHMPYARQVARFALELYGSLQPLHKFPPELGKLLHASAYLHDTGHFISDTGHHKHSAYIVANSDLPGFTDSERHLMSLLCRYHRKSLPTVRHDVFRDLDAEQRRLVQMLTPILRLSVALDSSKEQKIEELVCSVTNGCATLKVASDREFDLELWAAERAADIFRQIFGASMTIERLRP